MYELVSGIYYDYEESHGIFKTIKEAVDFAEKNGVFTSEELDELQHTLEVFTPNGEFVRIDKVAPIPDPQKFVIAKSLEKK